MLIADVLLKAMDESHLNRSEVFRTDPIALAEMDPSEAVRSGDILSSIHEQFDVIRIHPRGGTVLAPIFGSGCILPEALRSSEALAQLHTLCEQEWDLITAGELPSDHVVLVARPKKH